MIISNFSTMRSAFSVTNDQAQLLPHPDGLPFVKLKFASIVPPRDQGVAVSIDAPNPANSGTYAVLERDQHLAADEVLISHAGAVVPSAIVDVSVRTQSGFEYWPAHLVNQPQQIAGLEIDKPFAGLINVTANASANDAIPAVDEFDWYLRQRTDEPTKQIFHVTQLPAAPGQSRSGSIVLSLTAYALQEYPTLGTATPAYAEIAAALRSVTLFVREVATGQIRVVDLDSYYLAQVAA